MSIDITIYIETTAALKIVTERIGVASVATDLAHATVGVPGRPNFLADMYGFEPTIRISFRLEKTQLIGARAVVANAVRNYLEHCDDNIVVVYIDFPIVKRVDGVRLCREGYRDFVPPAQDWPLVPAIEVPE